MLDVGEDPEDEHIGEPNRWRTYQWAYRDTSPGMSPLMELRIRASLERAMFARCLQRSDPPELLTTFYRERRDGGALVVEICDARTLLRLWRGVASWRTEGDDASRAVIEDMVGAVLQGLPASLDAGVSPRGLDPLAAYPLPT